MTDLDTLIARVKAASGPDRELDRLVWRHFNPVPPEKRTSVKLPPGFGGGALNDALDPTPRLTASVDSALALAEKVLPDHFMTLKTKTGGAFHHCEIEGEDDGEWKAVNVPSLALAIILALLRSLLNTTEGGETE